MFSETSPEISALRLSYASNFGRLRWRCDKPRLAVGLNDRGQPTKRPHRVASSSEYHEVEIAARIYPSSIQVRILAMTRVLEIPDGKNISVVIRPPLSDLEFEELCAANPNLNLGRTKDGEIVVNALTISGNGDANSEINAQLRVWWWSHFTGKVYASPQPQPPKHSHLPASSAGRTARRSSD